MTTTPTQQTHVHHYIVYHIYVVPVSVHSACLCLWQQQPGNHQPHLDTYAPAGAQLVLSMLPNLESVWWTSVIGAATSIGYTVLIVGIGAAGTTVSTVEGDLIGRFDVPLLQRIIATCTAVGEVISSFGSAVVQIEVQHTLREPPDSKTSMRKAISMAMAIALVLYLLVSWLGYASLGRAASSTGSVLLVFSGVPDWVMLLGNAMVLAHMLTTYQVYCQVCWWQQSCCTCHRCTFDTMNRFRRTAPVPDYATPLPC